MNTNKVKLKIKKGDEVIVIAGKDKGKRGDVLAIRFLKSGKTRVLVSGANLVKKHAKGNPQNNEPGGIKEQEAYLDISNVMIYDAAAKKRSRVGSKKLDNGDKVRYYKVSGEVVGKDSK